MIIRVLRRVSRRSGGVAGYRVSGPLRTDSRSITRPGCDPAGTSRMNTERLLSAGMAVVVIAALGFSASTLATSMSTDPADAVDVQWDTLPLGEGSQGDIEAAAENVDETYRQSGDGDAESQGGSGDAQQQESQVGDGGSQDQQAGDEPGDGEPQGESGDGGDAQAGSADQQGGQSDSLNGNGLVRGGPPLSLLLWLALLLALIILAYRYRDRLRQLVSSDDEGPGAEPMAPAPQNEVERAWV